MLRKVDVRWEKFSDFLQQHICNNIDILKTGREIRKLYSLDRTNMVTVCALKFTVGKCNLDEISNVKWRLCTN